MRETLKNVRNNHPKAAFRIGALLAGSAVVLTSHFGLQAYDSHERQARAEAAANARDQIAARFGSCAITAVENISNQPHGAVGTVNVQTKIKQRDVKAVMGDYVKYANGKADSADVAWMWPASDVKSYRNNGVDGPFMKDEFNMMRSHISGTTGMSPDALKPDATATITLNPLARDPIGYKAAIYMDQAVGAGHLGDNTYREDFTQTYCGTVEKVSETAWKQIPLDMPDLNKVYATPAQHGPAFTTPLVAQQ